MGAGRSVLLGLLLATGCRQILGIDDPTLATPSVVTGHVLLRDSSNDPNGVPAARVRGYTSDELVLTVELDDGSTPEVELGADGAFTFTRESAEQPYRLSVTTPHGTAVYEHQAEQLELADRRPGRDEAKPVTQPTVITIPTTTTLDGPILISTGVWSQSFPATPASGDPITFDWRDAAPLAPTGLLRAEANDLLYLGLLKILTTHVTLSKLVTYNVTLVDGQPQTLSGPARDVPLDHCAKIQARRASAGSRLRAAQPAFGDNTQVAYIIGASADGVIGDPFVRLLLYDTVSSDASDDVMFGNPFPGTHPVLSLEAHASRTVDRTPGLVLQAGGLVTVPIVSTATSCPLAELALSIEVPGVPAISGIPLATDDLPIGLGAGVDPVVTWGAGSAGVADMHSITLYEVAGTTMALPHTVTTVGTSATLDRAWLSPGKTYVFAIDTVMGLAGAATGDFDTWTDPTGYMRTWSSTFHVAD